MRGKLLLLLACDRELLATLHWREPGHTAAFTVYVLVFHFLANLPLDNPLLFGIQARFWMQVRLTKCSELTRTLTHILSRVAFSPQPNLLVFIFTGAGLHVVLAVFIGVARRAEQNATDGSSCAGAIARLIAIALFALQVREI